MTCVVVKMTFVFISFGLKSSPFRRKNRTFFPPSPYSETVNGEIGALLLCPCLFRSSDNVWRSLCADAPRCAPFSTVISPSWITEQISVGKCMHRGASERWERQTSFKIATWTKQTWTNITTPRNKVSDLLGNQEKTAFL